MAKLPRKGFLIAGAFALGLALLFRRDVAKGVAVAAKAVGLDSATEALLRRVEGLPKVSAVAYSMLPPGPPEIGPLAANSSIDDLVLSFRAKIPLIEAELARILTPHGITFKRGETLRTWARQTYLYGIGRAYKAAGRTGTVTNAIAATGNHPKGKAIDYFYYRAGKYLGSAEDSEQVRKLISPHVSRFTAMGVTWGGVWPSPDVPHFEEG